MINDILTDDEEINMAKLIASEGDDIYVVFGCYKGDTEPSWYYSLSKPDPYTYMSVEVVTDVNTAFNLVTKRNADLFRNKKINS